MIKRLSVSFLLLATTAGCAQGGAGGIAASGDWRTIDVEGADAVHRFEVSRMPATTVTLAAPAERVWAELPGVYAYLGLDGESLDAARGVFGTRETTVRRRLGSTPLSRVVNCGSRAGIQNADVFSVQLIVRTHVGEGTGGTSVRTEVDASGRPAASSEPWTRCSSTHHLEAEIQRLLRGRLEPA